jgi:hypothetical protein
MHARHTQGFTGIGAAPSKTLVNRTRMKVVNIALTKGMKKFLRHCERSEAIQSDKKDWIASSLRSSQ